MKKKQKGEKNEKSMTAIMCRAHTETESLSRKNRKREPSDGNYEIQEEEVHSKKMKIDCKQLLKQLMKVKTKVEKELQNLLAARYASNLWKVHQFLLSSQLFRVRDISKAELLEQYGKILQALELLYSKLYNNEKVKDILHVKDEEDLLLFFKHLFGKPYTICNLPPVRKVISLIWYKNRLPSYGPAQMAEHLQLWSHGIELPINPAAICLQKMVLTSSKNIKRQALLLNNQTAYCEINGADCLGMTPLLIAVHCNKFECYQELVKSGCDLYRCPLTLIKGEKSLQVTKKADKTQIEMNFPITQRHQFNALQILAGYKQFQQIVNLFSFDEIAKMKKLKKSKQSIREMLLKIPNCSFQIHWKTYKGLLTFKQLPRDIITVYKKEGSIRIDYHIDDLEKPNPANNYSILIRALKNKDEKLQYFFIDHSSKKIHNLVRQVDSSRLRQRYQQQTEQGNIQMQHLSSIKSIEKSSSRLLELCANFYFQNVLKATSLSLKSVEQYEKAIYSSELVDYRFIQKSETECLIHQKIGNLPKVKSKMVKSTSNIKVQWIQEQINITHILDVLKILDRKSGLFVRLQKILDILVTEECYSLTYAPQLPVKINMDMGTDYNLEIQIKNINYLQLDEAIFGLEYRVKNFAYEEIEAGLESLQETVLLDENYSIDISKFLGRTEKLLEIEDMEANRKFQELLTRQIEQNSDEQENYYFSDDQ